MRLLLLSIPLLPLLLASCAPMQIGNRTLGPNSVTTADLQNGAVTHAKLDTVGPAVQTDTIAAGAVTDTKIANGAVGNTQLAAGAAVANIGYTPQQANTTVPIDVEQGVGCFMVLQNNTGGAATLYAEAAGSSLYYGYWTTSGAWTSYGHPPGTWRALSYCPNGDLCVWQRVA